MVKSIPEDFAIGKRGGIEEEYARSGIRELGPPVGGGRKQKK